MAEFIFSEKDLAFNFHRLENLAGESRIIAVVKSDGYGLGLLEESRILVREGCRILAVDAAQDALALREDGILTDILLMTPVYDPKLLETLIARRITCSVTSVDSALELEAAAQRTGKRGEAHLLIDSGLTRHGFSLSAQGEILQAARILSKTAVTGIYSHPSCVRRSILQGQRFVELCDALHQKGLQTGLRHFCSSSCFFACPELHLDGVRLGSAILGCGKGAAAAGLRRVGWLRGTVEDVYDRPRGSRVGYGAGERLWHDTRIAVVSIGYRDGFGLGTQPNWFRLLHPERLQVMIGGTACPVVGRVGCSSLMADVGGISCRAGDEATAFADPLLTRKSTRFQAEKSVLF